MSPEPLGANKLDKASYNLFNALENACYDWRINKSVNPKSVVINEKSYEISSEKCRQYSLSYEQASLNAYWHAYW